jgi:hypothetical protein
MPVVEIPDNKKYEKALGMLYRMGGMFRTRPTHVLVIGPAAYRALVEAGLVEPDGKEARRRGKKKKST